MKAFLRISTAAALTVALLFGCSGNGKNVVTAFPDSLVDDEEIVAVASQPITGRDLRVFTIVYQPAAVDSTHSRMYNLQLLNGYIDRFLLWQEANAQGVAVGDSTTNWYVAQFLTSMGGETAFYKFLGDMDITPQDLRNTIHRDLIVRSFIEGTIATGVSVPDEEVREFYDANRERFSAKDSVRARHIILRSSESDTEEDKQRKRARLEDLRRQVEGGADFAVLARSNSEGPSAPRGGDLGHFSRADMVKPFSDAAFALQEGEVSGVVETNFGYHIIKVESRKSAQETTFEDAEAQIRSMLQQRQLNTELELRLKRNREVAIIEPKFDFGGLTQRESATFTR